MSLFLENCKAGRVGKNYLLWAAYHGNVKAIKFLLQFEQLDVNIVDKEGRTALLTAIKPKESLKTLTINEYDTQHLYSPRRTLKMVKMLYQVNKDSINQCTRTGDSPLQYAMYGQSVKVVEILVKLGAQVNHKNEDGETVLHTAALNMRWDILRYLLSKTICDPYAKCNKGWLPCYVFMYELIFIGLISEYQFKFGLNFISLSHKTPLEESANVCCLLLDCFDFKDGSFGPRAKVLFREIVKLVTVNHPKRRLVEKILELQPQNNYSLIWLLIFKNCVLSSPYEKSDKLKYMLLIEKLKLCFLEELLPLFLKDETFANEYVAEFARIGWTFCNTGIIFRLFRSTPLRPTDEIICKLEKMLLRHGFDFKGSGELGTLSTYVTCEHIKIAPDNWAPSSVSKLNGFGCVNVVNESANWMLNHYRLSNEQDIMQEVSSLQHLSRMSLRRHAFQNYDSHGATTFLNSLNFPVHIKNFVSYNY